MEFYFDIEFLKALNIVQLSDEVKMDFKKFVKSLSDVKCFVFKSDNLAKSDLESIPYYDLLTDNPGVKHLAHAELKDVLENEKTTGFKFFFVDHLSSIEGIKNDYGYFCLNSDGLNTEWHHLESGRQDLRRSVSNKKSEKNISAWEDLNNFFRFPINSLIISDRYAFKEGSSPQINILKLINSLNLKPLTKRKIDVVIIADTFKKLMKIQNEQNNLKFNSIFLETQALFNQILGKDNYNLSFLLCDQQTQPSSEKIHSRVLWTNVLLLNPGDSFSFFKEDTISKKIKVKRFEYLNVDFFLWSRARHKEHIDIFRNAINSIQNGTPNGSEPSLQRVKIHGERSCRLLF